LRVGGAHLLRVHAEHAEVDERESKLALRACERFVKLCACGVELARLDQQLAVVVEDVLPPK
jgi:hypothetical protein